MCLRFIFAVNSILLIMLIQYLHGEDSSSCFKKIQSIYPCRCSDAADGDISITCEMANLAILGVSLSNLAKLHTKIGKLTILRGSISRIYGPVFAKVNAKALTISQTPLKLLEEYSFHGVNQTLEKLLLHNSNLQVFPDSALGILGKLTELGIDGHAIKSLDKDILFDTNISHHLEILRIVNGNLSQIPNESLQNLKKLKILDLHGNNLKTLAKNQFKNLRSVEVLDLSFNVLESLQSPHITDLTKLGWLNISHNELKELPRGTFARNSVIKVLNLSYNQIKRLDANTFRGMRFLRRLYLNNNNITEIGRGTFGSITKIGTIDLSRNFLKKIEYQMFSDLKYAEILDIAENAVTEIQKHSFKDIYQVKINLSHNAINKIEPLAFVNCVNITFLDFSFNRLTSISQSSFDFTTFATVLQFSHNLLRDLLQVPLQNMTGLKILNVSFNDISTIPKSTFPKLYELHTIDVSNNNVSFIANGVFQSLFSLRNLNISKNNLEDINTYVFGSLPTLLQLDLSYNHLHSIARASLAKLSSLNVLYLNNNLLNKLFLIPSSLQKLNMSKNKLTSIPSTTWPTMNSLLFLDLSENELEDTLNGESFLNLLVLQKLILNRNNLSKLPAAALSIIPTLQYLFLKENNITILDKNAFGKLPVLFELSLHGNDIREIRKHAFDGLLQLLSMDISGNSLQLISPESFINLPSLRVLDLSHNYLTKLDNKTNSVLENLLSLEKLNASYNNISFITKKTFPSNLYIPYNLTVVDLSHNVIPVLTYDIVFGTDKLKILNLSHNYISEIKKGVLGNLTSLNYLDLSYNYLTDLSENETFHIPKNLTEIYLQHNNISRISFHDFIKEIKFKIIDLRVNQLKNFPLSLVWNLKNGTNVLFEGNPLNCDCTVRPLKRFLNIKTTGENAELICAQPPLLENKFLVNIAEETLHCTTDEHHPSIRESYELLPDIQFREISINETSLNPVWFVSSNRDVSDFMVFIRDDEKLLYQAEINYNERSMVIPLSSMGNSFDKNLELCIVARTSDGHIGKWFDTQCSKLQNLFLKNESFHSSKTSAILNITNNWIYVYIVLGGIILFDKYYSSCFYLLKF